MTTITGLYAGVGSRETPPAILAVMTEVANHLAQQGWMLRSGGANGADQAFESGCGMAGFDPDPMEIWVPWRGFNGYAGNVLDAASQRKAEAIAARMHPAWHRCRRGARMLHARNAAIMFGAGVGTASEVAVDAVVCWTKTGGPDGGTGMAIRIAEDRGIPVVNLHDVKTADAVLDRVLLTGGQRP